jgi:regulator of protease activity HflC (stomatin/prohibitin superfamily)
VVEAYRDVSRAESDRQRRINEGSAVRSEKLAEAEGKAKAMINGAQAESDRQLARASSEADSFLYQLAARESSPSLTDFRLYWEAIALAFSGKAKLILDARADRPQRLVLTRLPMDQSIPLIESDKGSKKTQTDSDRAR